MANFLKMEGKALLCVTHHHGCDCREFSLLKAEADREYLLELLRRVWHEGGCAGGLKDEVAAALKVCK